MLLWGNNRRVVFFLQTVAAAGASPDPTSIANLDLDARLPQIIRENKSVPEAAAGRAANRRLCRRFRASVETTSWRGSCGVEAVWPRGRGAFFRDRVPFVGLYSYIFNFLLRIILPRGVGQMLSK